MRRRRHREGQLRCSCAYIAYARFEHVTRERGEDRDVFVHEELDRALENVVHEEAYGLWLLSKCEERVTLGHTCCLEHHVAGGRCRETLLRHRFPRGPTHAFDGRALHLTDTLARDA